MKRHQAKATQWSSPKDIIQAMWYLRNSLSLWYDLKLFIVCLQLAAVTGLLNRLGLSSIPLRERVECLALQLERNCCFLGKVTKITKCIGHKNPRKKPSLLTKIENWRLNWRKPENRARHQTRKSTDFKCKNWKTEPKIGQIFETEKPNDPLFLALIINNFSRAR